MADLQQYNIVGQFQQGYDRGRGQQASRLAGLAYSSQGADRQEALGKLAGIDPRAAMGLTNAFQQQDAQQAQAQQAQEIDHAKKINGAANFMLQAVKTGDPARIQGAYQTVRPYLAELGASEGKVPPEQFDPSMLPHIYAIAGQTGGLPENKPVILSNGAQLVDPSTGQVVANNALEQKDPEAIATLKALQSDPALMHTYQQMHPRPASVGGGRPKPRFGWQYAADGSLEPVKGGPYDQSSEAQGLSPEAVDNAAWSYIGTGKLPPIGRGKEGVAQRTAIMNEAAKIAKQAGISPAELQTVPGRNRALQSSLTNLQKTSDVMEKSEQAFLNNTNTALDISSRVDRTGSPVINKWLLGGKDAMGDPDVRALDAAITTMAVDYARIMSGATGAGGTPISTADEARSLIKKELSDKSLRAVVQVLEQDIKGQQQAVHDQRGKILGAMQALHDSAAPGASQQPQEQPRPRATNPQTGETVELVNGQWVPVNG